MTKEAEGFRGKPCLPDSKYPAESDSRSCVRNDKITLEV
jgi:hypothetical protein